MSVKLKPITETAWLVLGDTDDIRIGLLTEIRSQYVLMAQGEKKQFLDRKEVNTFFDEDIFSNIVVPATDIEEKKDYFVNGYPVDFDRPNEVSIEGCELPLFSKKATSDVFYCAGYYCIHFPKNWTSSFSPKYATLQAYEYKGPFKDEATMKFELLKLRRDEK